MEAAIYAAKDGSTWVIASRSQRQSNEVKRRAKLFLAMMCPQLGLNVVTDNNDDGLIFNNGGRILAVPSNPDTISGFTGNVVLDEYARHKDQAGIWEALYATISSRPDLRLSVVSTPLGCEGMFYKLVDAARSGRPNFPWSMHEVNIHDAIANGCRHNVDELRAGCFDDTIFRQSYLCEFVDEAYALLPYELLSRASDAGLPYRPQWEKLRKRPNLYAGCDVGRTRDLFVITVGEQHPGGRWTVHGVTELKQNDYEQMEREIHRTMSLPSLRRMCIDRNGIGDQLTERAEKRYGGRIEGVKPSLPFNNEIGHLMKRLFVQGHIAIPDVDELHDDLHSVRREVTTAGNLRLVAPTENGSHADRYYSMALMAHAGDGPKGLTVDSLQSIGGNKRRSSLIGM